MADTFSFSMDDTAVRKKFTSLEKGVNDFTVPLTSAGDELVERYGEGPFSPFAKQQTGDGQKWKELAPSTLRAREKRQGHYARMPIMVDKILIWTGDLMRGFKKKVTSTMLTISNDVEYFKYHQPGQRKMLFVNSSVINIVARHLIKHIDKSIK